MSCNGVEEASLNDQLKPLFIFSLPRSGSTLLQRILAAHHDIETVSEPCFLLPLIYTMRKDSVYAEYGHKLVTTGIEDLCRELPRGENDYHEAIHDFAMSLYGKASQRSVKYFLDKTPRYSLIVDDIIRIFPEGKFIVLVRNPLAIISSILETFKGGRWCLYAYNADLFIGLSKLISACKEYADRIHLVRYEDLITEAETVWQPLFEYMGLSFDKELFVKFNSIELKGLGDPVGAKQYKFISEEPLLKWKRSLSNPLRKAWCRRYLCWVGKERLKIIGYDLDNLLSELDSIPSTMHMFCSDFVRIPYGVVSRVMEPELVMHKVRLFPDWHKINLHY